ncbi:MIP/aquaporin family protein [Pseudochelatococcus contaminans]|uniref:Glycerol uptake facilitator-like aquaporin n=1 Tax=Pseudochelatococcus contaminans TaxID=1538103 RepID=A0A7W6EI25_9HYPH|nr:MIP/aquaporin family protein [Pseudochelatococcus contaminans]MBB3810618.1 glycerol uptake facilitator-like aquaporin [Pseudochelatococcus contaminans]
MNVNNDNEAAYGRFALASQVGPRFTADWKSDNHRARRLVAEFIGSFGLTFVLSGGAAVLAANGGAELAPYQFAFILSAVSALWLVAAVYCLGDISAHFNPAMTLGFTLRGDMTWPMTLAYFVVQFIAASAGSLTAAELFGYGGNLAATIPQPGQLWGAVILEAILTFGMVLVVLSMADGPKLVGSAIPIAVGAYVMAAGTMGGPYDGAAFNPARAFGPNLARGDLSTYWVYPLGSAIGVVVAVLVARFLRGPAKAEEAQAAMGSPLDKGPS